MVKRQAADDALQVAANLINPSEISPPVAGFCIREMSRCVWDLTLSGDLCHTLFIHRLQYPMGCYSSKQIDDTTGYDRLTEPKPPTNAASPETKISTARQASLPTGTDMAQFDSSRQAAGRGGFMRSRGSGVSTQPDEFPKSHRHPSLAKQSVLGKNLPATDPDVISPNKLQGSSSASKKHSERVNAWGRTGQLTERTMPKYTGGFSEVSLAKLGDRVVAVKVLRVGNIKGGESRIWKEIYVWTTLDHPNVLELLRLVIEDGRPCLISPWCENGTLPEYLHKFPNANRRRLVREIAEGLRYLHEQTPPIIHGDLKTANIFITGDCLAKISGIGTSRRVEQARTDLTTSDSFLATVRYTAPEILQDGRHSTLWSDVFSFACVALETMSDKCPFWKISNVVQVINQVVFEKQTPSPEHHSGMEDALWELLRRCWNYEPSDRPAMIDVCQTLAGAGYGPSTSFYLPPRAGPSTSFYRIPRARPSLTYSSNPGRSFYQPIRTA